MKYINCVLVIVLFSCDGDIGPDGLVSLIKTSNETSGSNCATGGLKIETGLDVDRDLVLSSSEVQAVQYICNGSNGTNGLASLVNTMAEPAGEFCTNGGTRIEVGLDANSNKSLEASEISQVRYICNGENAAFDKVIMLPIWITGTGWASTGGTFTRGNLPFDINDYDGVDSIAYTFRGAVSGSGTYELVNLEDGTPISGSTIDVGPTGFTQITSGKITIPNKPLILALHVTNNSGTTQLQDNVYLILYRSE